MCCTWLSTVFGEMTSCPAICFIDWPRASKRRTSTSRSLRPPTNSRRARTERELERLAHAEVGGDRQRGHQFGQADVGAAGFGLRHASHGVSITETQALSELKLLFLWLPKISNSWRLIRTRRKSKSNNILTYFVIRTILLPELGGRYGNHGNQQRTNRHPCPTP